MPAAAVSACGLVKRFADRVALEGVDLEVAEGSVHGLLGPNGAGKTTLLRALFGLVRLDGGTVELFGRALGDADRLDRVAGFVETPMFYPYLSGRKNLLLLSALDGRADRHAVQDALDRVGLRDRANDRAGGYSLGMRQRLGIAAALIRTPRLLVLDEPANGLDPGGARDLRALVRRLAGEGLTVLLSSHDMAEVDELCDAVTILAAGSVARTGSMAALREQAPDPTSRLRTSDDVTALELARRSPALGVSQSSAGGLTVTAAQRDVDDFVLALGRAGIAVRGLTTDVAPLTRLFFALTERQRQPAPTGHR